ncbi:DUF6301 family protein [Streptomyces sp. NPDC050418]|uniref:DUF6301 family protein n=1 Tax=Streptomyces sp. NPDC050418 TaxID=3365612 RepID=UPI0037889DA8
MTQWRALSDGEVVEFAARLRSLDCTWELGATSSARRSAQFTRKALMIRPRWDLLDTGFESSRRASGRGATAQDGEMVERVQLRLSDYVDRWDHSLDAFVRMTAALSTALGEPTDRRPGADAEVHWAAADTALVLRSAGALYLELVTRNRLALDEELRQLDAYEDGL